MKKNVKDLLTLSITGAIIFGFSLWCIIKPAGDVSNSERRPLAQLPKLSMEAVLSGSFSGDFEEYSADQFPLRESFRRIKALSSYYLFRRGDNNGVYIADGYASKLEYPLKEDSYKRAAQRFERVYEKYLREQGSKVYFSLIPDKNRFMAEQNGYPAMDYQRAEELMKECLPFMEYIPIYDLLEIEDYYRTDTHWRQERIVDVAERLASSMGSKLSGEYRRAALANPFYGVYYGQAALPMPGEELNYLENEVISNLSVYDHETGKTISVYDMEKAGGTDPYEMFLSGSKSLLTIENPMADNDKELIVFRDSFGSSIVPLLAEGYASVTVVDIRYVSSEMLGNFIDFHGQDVLFLYSTMVLNNSVTLK